MVYSFQPMSGNMVQRNAISTATVDMTTHLATYNHLNVILLGKDFSLLTVTSFALNGRMMI